MSESESAFLPSPLPPKRRAALSSEISQKQVDQAVDGQEDAFPEEMDPALLAEFEQALLETGKEVIIDLSNQSSSLTAPILERYIDPLTVPIEYLLEQARANSPIDSSNDNLEADEDPERK